MLNKLTADTDTYGHVQVCPKSGFSMGTRALLNTWFFEPTLVYSPNDILIGLVAFSVVHVHCVQHTEIHTEQTDRQTTWVTINHI